MNRGRADFALAMHKATRNERLWECSNIVSAIFTAAGKSCDRPPTAKQIYDQLTGEVTPADEEDEDDSSIGSLAALKAERRAKEAQQRGEIEH